MTDDVRPYTELPGMDDLPQIADSLYDTLQTIKQLEEVASDLKAQLAAKLTAARAKKVSYEGERTVDGQTVRASCKVVLADGRETRKLDVKKLQAQGVTSKVIEASYVTSVGAPSIRLYTGVEA